MKRKGIVLAVVLWMITLLSVMVYFISGETHLGVRYLKVKNQYEFSEPLFRSAYLYSKAILSADPTPDTDSVNDEFYDNPLLFKEGKNEDTTFPFSIEYSPEENKTCYGFEFLNTRLNVNYLTPEQIERILDNTDFTEEQIAALQDWIDKDNDPHNHGAGAENDYYQDQGIPYSALNSPLQDWSTLYLIKGMTPDFADFIKNNLTCHGDGKVNIHMAADQTLKWLGFSESLIQKIREYLAGPDLIFHTQDDPVFEDVNTLITTLNEAEPLENDETEQIRKALPLLTLSTSCYRLHVRVGGLHKTWILKKGFEQNTVITAPVPD